MPSKTTLLELTLQEIANLPHKKDGKVLIGALNNLVPRLKNDHALAVQLWDTEISAARQLAVRIADPNQADETLLEKWVGDLADWDLTDAYTGQLVKYTKHSVPKAYAWAKRPAEFERRAGFATIAQMAWSKNEFGDAVFIDFLPCILEAATDRRLYVKKAVNWALRDIGKRNSSLRHHAQRLSSQLQSSSNKTAKWIGTHRSHEIFGD